MALDTAAFRLHGIPRVGGASGRSAVSPGPDGAGQARRWNVGDRMTTRYRHPRPRVARMCLKVAPRALTPRPPPPMAADCCGTVARGGVEIGPGATWLRVVPCSVPNQARGSTSCAASFADRAGAHALCAAGGHGHDGHAVAAVQAPRWRSKKRLEWAVQGHFNAPAKRLRAEHRRPHADRPTHGQFRPSDGRAVSPNRALEHRERCFALGKLATMADHRLIAPPKEH
jgi:hypothetical protein